MKEIVRNRDCLYSVNNYQRFYVWDDNKVNTYLSDILKVIGQAQSTPVIPKHFFRYSLFSAAYLLMVWGNVYATGFFPLDARFVENVG